MSGANDLVVRPAKPADLGRMRAMWSEAAIQLVKLDPRQRLAPEAEQIWEKAAETWLQRPDSAVFVAVLNDNPIAYIVGQIEAARPGFVPDRIGVVSELAVDFHAKRGGLGRILLDALQKWFKAHGVTSLEARVPLAHPVAQAFWRAVGAGKISEQMWLRLD